MRRHFAALRVFLAVLIAPAAKGFTVRITIQGGDLAAPVEITDERVVAGFHVWAGPGTSTNEAQSLIVDWSRGPVDAPQDLPVYEVSFVTTRKDPGTYVVSYAIDPATREGYVFLPGKGTPGIGINTWLIYRGVEGHWFRAWSRWEKMAHPLIEKARKP